MSCSEYCATCEDTDPNKCLTCFSGTKLNPTTSVCDSDVSSCNSTKTCSACPLGFIVYQNQCHECSVTDSNCISCTYDSLSVCSSCRHGFYLQSGKCEKCADDCAYCVGKNKCIRCADGSYLTRTVESSTGVCKTCDEKCKTCEDNPRKCTSCFDDY